MAVNICLKTKHNGIQIRKPYFAMIAHACMYMLSYKNVPFLNHIKSCKCLVVLKYLVSIWFTRLLIIFFYDKQETQLCGWSNA